MRDFTPEATLKATTKSSEEGNVEENLALRGEKVTQRGLRKAAAPVRQLRAHWKPGIQLVEPGGEPRPSSTAGGAESEETEREKPLRRQQHQPAQCGERTASSAARHEGLHQTAH